MTSRSPRRSLAWLWAAIAVLVIAGLAVGTVTVQRAQRAPVTQGCAGSGSNIISFIGDSYTAGVKEDGGYSRRFPALIGARLGSEVLIRASNGSGYVAKGPASDALAYPGQAAGVDPQSAVVVISGSRNDVKAQGEAITSAAAQTFANVKAAAPNAKIVLVGPIWINNKPNDGILAARDAVKVAAQSNSVSMVDPLELGWFGEADKLVGGRSSMIGADAIHPTSEGQAYLADKIEPLVRAALCPSS